MSNANTENEKNKNLSDSPDNGEYDNLKVANLNIDNDSKFNSALILDADKITPKNSIDSIGMKFSIDYAPKQRIHEYLNNDLINALDTGVSPQMPKSSDSNNDKKNLMEQIPVINLSSTEEINYNNPMLNQIPFDNNFNKMQILNNLNSHQIINSNQNQNENDVQMNVNSNSYFPKNYFINNNINNNYVHKHHNNKGKKPFEIREGDWTCFHCNNLNFSFRLKCNRCGLSKELSTQKILSNKNV